MKQRLPLFDVVVRFFLLSLIVLPHFAEPVRIQHVAGDVLPVEYAEYEDEADEETDKAETEGPSRSDRVGAFT